MSMKPTIAKQHLLNAVSDIALEGIAIFKAIRDEQNNVIEFRHWTMSKTRKPIPDRRSLKEKMFLSTCLNARDSGIFERLQHVVNTGEILDSIFFYLSEAGSKWLHIKARKFQDDILVSMNDVTEQKLIEKRIKEQAHFIREVTLATPDVIQVIDIEKQKVVYVNRTMYEDLGYSAGVIKEMTMEELRVLHHPDDLDKLLAFRESFNTLDDTSVKEYVGRVRAKNGSWVWLRNHGKVFNRNEAGEVTQYLMISQNITKEKSAEEELTASSRQSDQAINQLNKVLVNKNEKLESLDSEIKSINKIAAHDYANMLKTTYIQLEYIILNDARHLSDAGKASIRRAQAGIQKMKLLTEDIVAFTQIPSLDGEPSPVDLNEIVRIVLDNMSEKIKETEAHIVCDQLPIVPGHANFLFLLFYHLISNSIRHRIKQVTPAIRIRYSRTKRIAKDKSLSNSIYEKISIIDNGIGFESKDVDIIFDIFYRLSDKSKYKGTGVSLAICKKIMNLHNGYITAYSRLGKWSIFSCFFHL